MSGQRGNVSVTAMLSHIIEPGSGVVPMPFPSIPEDLERRCEVIRGQPWKQRKSTVAHDLGSDTLSDFFRPVL